MHITASEYQTANPVSTKDDRMKEMLQKIRLRLIIIPGKVR